MADAIEQFLAGQRFAVVGASQDRGKYGNKVLRCYLQKNLDVVPVNPKVDEIEGLTTVPDLAAAGSLGGVSIVTPPAVTKQVVEQAISLGIRNLWMQPGAESEPAIAAAERAGVNVIAGGPCILVALGFRDI